MRQDNTIQYNTVQNKARQHRTKLLPYKEQRQDNFRQF